IRQSEQEIVTGSRLVRKPPDNMSAGSGMGSVPMLRRRAAAVPDRENEIPGPAAPATQRGTGDGPPVREIAARVAHLDPGAMSLDPCAPSRGRVPAEAGLSIVSSVRRPAPSGWPS